MAALLPWHVSVTSPFSSNNAIPVCRVSKTSYYMGVALSFRLSGYASSGVLGVMSIMFSPSGFTPYHHQLGIIGSTKFLYKEIGDYIYLYITGTNDGSYQSSIWEFWTTDKLIDFNIDHGPIQVSSIGGTEF